MLRARVHIEETTLQRAVAKRNSATEAIGEYANLRDRRRCIVERQPRQCKLSRGRTVTPVECPLAVVRAFIGQRTNGAIFRFGNAILFQKTFAAAANRQ